MTNKINKWFKIFGATFLAALLTFSLLSLCACGKEETVKKSEVRGTYTYSKVYGQDKSLHITSDATFAASEYKYEYLLATGWPEKAGDGQSISYAIDQRLKLAKDYTYFYEYTIALANPNDWGGSVASISVSMAGTYTYIEKTDTENKEYTVTLSNPVSGTRTVYASTITDAKSIYNWTKHGDPDLVEDLAYLSTLPSYNFDKYTCGRKVKVTNDGENLVLSDDIFFIDILMDLAKYNNY